ncbi:MAG: 6,7-dimethyl-8-ribityllumazine synthase [Gammaproteobacteria bacterium]|nr:6,7-dimethyl-8-ribityllumazine synthase [Gammaproteobacteria bacterium]
MPILKAETINPDFKVAIVVSRYNLDITQELLAGAVTRLFELGLSEASLTVTWVPGAVEIPLTAQRLARTKKFEAVICLGAVIFGETRHFDYVCDQVSQGCQQVALSSDLPIIFGVLTTDNLAQAQDRIGGAKGHVGRQSADAAVEMISLLRQIEVSLSN